MAKAAHKMRLVPRPADEPSPGDLRRDPGLTAEDLDAARELADFHRVLAADLPPRSRLRGLALRCASHWSRLGAIPRNGLTTAERGKRDRH